MKNKYGIQSTCKYCSKSFTTRPRFVGYCSVPCKNPLNRGEYDPWNKGKKLTEEQKAKQNRDGLTKGWGWNKGLPNEGARKRFLENNPNKDGRLNNLRPTDPDVPAYKKYLGAVRKATYRTIKEMKLNNEWVPVVGKYKDDWQIDHIIPCKQGFEIGIDPHLLGQRNNIQFIKGSENRKKWHSYQPLEVLKSILGENSGLQ
jgi:hypothetical protein